jgi:protein-disulfide isomerase
MSDIKSARSNTRRQEMKEKRRKRQQQQQQQRALIFVGIGVVVLVILGIFIYSSVRNANTPVTIKEVTPVARPQTDGNSMGDPNAPVKLVEYSDFQCPYCRDFTEQVEPALVEEFVNTGKVYFTYRSMGKWIGQESVDAIEAAYCAGDQGKFWEYHDVVFGNWLGENVGSFSSKRLEEFAKYLNLNMSEFNSCRSSNKYLDQVNQDRADGDKLGVQGTPSFFINGKPYQGGLGIEGFRNAINAELQTNQ